MALSDPLLVPFLSAPDDEAAERELACLLEDTVAPLAREVLKRRLRSAVERQLLDDLHQDVLLQLTGRLRLLRIRHDEAPIEQFRGYVSVVAQRACDAHIRRRFPERTRLRSRIRYVLTHHPACQLDAGPAGMLCALRAWPAAKRADGRERLAQLPASIDSIPTLAGRDLVTEPLAGWLPAALEWIGAPVELDDFVSVLGALTGTNEPEHLAPDRDDAGGWSRVASAEPSHADRLEARSYLRWLWDELRELPARQREALLLSLRDESGSSVLPLLVLTGIAAIGAIAALLEMPLADLRALWPSLPVEDNIIAARLGITRQQVINLRKSARLRLQRRSRRSGFADAETAGDERQAAPGIRRRPHPSS